MDMVLNNYLEKIERYLKPLPVSERVDIVKEIKSEMIELQGNGKTAEEIIDRLGAPKELAKAYLGNLIAKDTSFRWSRVPAICAYYSLAGFSGLIVIPTLAICAPVFIFCGIITPILGAVKAVDVLLKLGLPCAQDIDVFGISNPVLVFVICVAVGVLLWLIGRGCWKLLVCYIKSMGRVKNHLSI